MNCNTTHYRANSSSVPGDPTSKLKNDPQAEAFLNFRFVTRDDTPWADRGHEIATEQLALPRKRATKRQPRRNIASSGKVDVSTHDNLVSLRAREIGTTFDRANGMFLSLQIGGENVIERGPLLQLWRGATDNDGIKLMLPQEDKPLDAWLKLGLDRLAHRCTSFTCEPARNGSVVVSITHAASGRKNWKDARHVHRYCVRPDGSVECGHAVTFGSRDMIDLPRIGTCMHFAPGFEALSWFGRGPHENYRDRKTAAHVGVHRTTVSATYVPYIMPQEHGHFTDTRWLELRGRDGPGVRVQSDRWFEFNATHHSAEDLYAARHAVDLPPRPQTLLYLDAAHRGLGTGSCGPDTLEQYRLLRRTYTWSHTLVPLSAS